MVEESGRGSQLLCKGERIMTLSEQEKLDAKLAIAHSRKCDKYDYLIAVGCGCIAGLVDIFLVGAPGDSVLGTWSDSQVDQVVMTFAKKTGWNGEGTASAIGYLERTFPVNYDQRYTSDVNNAFRMGTKNHHLKSLAHSPDPIGLFFSILDQFQSKASFIADGQIIRIDTSDSNFELRGGNFHSKIFCGFCNWIGHIMSDIAGSSGGRGNSAGGRGSGIAIPFYELFQFADFGEVQIGKDRQTFATLMIRVFQEGYDARFGMAMALPVLLADLFIRASWTIKQHFYHNQPWSECIPSSKKADLRWMLIVGHGTLCVFDGVDAAIRSGGNPIVFMLHLNLVAWFKLTLIVLKEIGIRCDFTYRDLELQFRRINAALDEYLGKLKSIDYAQYKNEIQELQTIYSLLEDDHAESDQIYQYFERHNIEMQFHSFEEFDEKMRDPNFVLHF